MSSLAVRVGLVAKKLFFIQNQTFREHNLIIYYVQYLIVTNLLNHQKNYRSF